MDVEEMTAIFLHIISFDVKNRIIKCQFASFSEIINRHFNIVLGVFLCFHEVLDGTYIKVNVLASDMPRYRSKKK